MKLYFAAAKAAERVAYAFILGESSESDIIKESRIVAEYTALIKGLKRALDAGITKLNVFGPRLIINQLNGVAAVKSSRARRLHDEARDLLSNFRKVELAAIQQERNKAHLLSIQALKEFFEGKAIPKSRKIS